MLTFEQGIEQAIGTLQRRRAMHTIEIMHIDNAVYALEALRPKEEDATQDDVEVQQVSGGEGDQPQ